MELELKELNKYLLGDRNQNLKDKDSQAIVNQSEITHSWQPTKKYFERRSGEVTSIAVAYDASFLAFRYGRTIAIRTLTNFELRYLNIEEKCLANIPTPIVVSKDKKWLVSGMIAFPDVNVVNVWEISSCKQVASFKGHDWSQDGRIKSVAITSDTENNKIVLSGGNDCVVRIWDLKSQGKLGEFKEHSSPVKAIIINENNQTIVSGDGEGIIKFWNLWTKETICSFKAHSESINSLAISPDVKLIASAGDDREIKLWDAETGKLLSTLEKHSASINSVTFSSDSRLLASGDSNGCIEIWNLETNKPMLIVSKHDKSVTSLAFMPNEPILISGSKDRTIKVWELIEHE
ncbi:MAG: WD40 repeat domain-containing protein [Richelia sp. SM1_7_0]|nr:WD40 repeat domain-containing protein [Richelia sp. SM1_7_0]